MVPAATVSPVGVQTLAAPARLTVWLRADVLLPVALAAIAQADVWAPASFNLGHLVGPAAVVSLLYIVTAAALYWRKRFPVAVLAFIVTVDALEYLAFGAPEGLGSLLPTVVAFYAVGRYARASALVVAGPLALLGIAVHELTDPVFTPSGSNAVFYAVVGGAWPLGQVLKRRAEHIHRLQATAEGLAAQQEVVSREAASVERARIARELHDIVGHGLSVTVLQLVGAVALLESDRTTEARSRLATTEETARQTLAEMRTLLGLVDEGGAALSPPPGLGRLDELIESTRLAGADITVQVSGDLTSLPPGLNLTAYRVMQESLTNVLRHARPPICTVRITRDSQQLTLEVCDAGRTLRPPTLGRGLTGMRERVSIFGGTLRAGPVGSGGFGVCACFPVSQR